MFGGKLIVNTIPGLLDQSAPLLDLCDNSDPRDVTTLIGKETNCAALAQIHLLLQPIDC